MLRKMILWSLYAAFFGLLLAVAAYRTTVKLADSEQEQSQGQTRRNQAGGETVTQAGIDQVNQDNHERIGLDGHVAGVSNQSLMIQLSDGQLLEISHRAWRYTQDLGFTPQVSDPLRLEGFYENGIFEITQLTNLHNSQSVLLRDENGHPLWSGNQ